MPGQKHEPFWSMPFLNTDQFRLPGKPVEFAPEIYLSLREGVFPLHPAGHASSHRETLTAEPNKSRWLSIFTLYPFETDQSFAEYYANAARQGLFQAQPLAEAYGKVKSGKAWTFLASAPGWLTRLYFDKNIPVKILMISGYEIQEKADSLQALSEIIHGDWCKNNIAREIFSMWIDLGNISGEQATLQEMQKCLANHRNPERREEVDNPAALSRKLKEIVLQKRYPGLSQKKATLNQMIREFSGVFSIQYDEAFEENSLTLSAKIKNREEWEALQKDLSRVENRQLAEKIFDYWRGMFSS